MEGFVAINFLLHAGYLEEGIHGRLPGQLQAVPLYASNRGRLSGVGNHVLEPPLGHVSVHRRRALLVRSLEVFSHDEVLDTLLDERYFGFEPADELCEDLADELRMAEFLPGPVEDVLALRAF